ncbi:hypothetical protein M9458_038948, partial [Cirrhinus mrigala]
PDQQCSLPVCLISPAAGRDNGAVGERTRSLRRILKPFTDLSRRTTCVKTQNRSSPVRVVQIGTG